LNRSYVGATSKPVTEFVEFSLKQGADQKAALTAMKKLWVWLDTNHPVDGTYGPFVEDVNHYLFIIGWNTVDVSKLFLYICFFEANTGANIQTGNSSKGPT
jgi:hypothetical protein